MNYVPPDIAQAVVFSCESSVLFCLEGLALSLVAAFRVGTSAANADAVGCAFTFVFVENTAAYVAAYAVSVFVFH